MVDERIDFISSVSGGSLTAALYSVSCPPEELDPKKTRCPRTYHNTDRRKWIGDEVFAGLRKNFISRWRRNVYLRPDNWLALWLTHFDRTDVLAEVFEDVLFDTSIVGGEAFTFVDLNPSRP